MSKIMTRTIAEIAKDKGYRDTGELLRDYGVVPTVMIPRHKKIELIPLIVKQLISDNQKQH